MGYFEFQGLRAKLEPLNLSLNWKFWQPLAVVTEFVTRVSGRFMQFFQVFCFGTSIEGRANDSVIKSKKAEVIFQTIKKTSTMTLTKYRSFRPSIFHNYFDDAFIREVFYGASNGERHFVPRTNVKENEQAFQLELAVPGFDKNDFKVEVEKDVLTIAASHRDERNEEKENYSRREFWFGQFTRSFNLPDTVNADAITAEYVNGILNVTIPKKEMVVKNNSKQITVN